MTSDDDALFNSSMIDVSFFNDAADSCNHDEEDYHEMLHPFDDVGDDDDDDDGCRYADGQRYLDINDIHGHDISHERDDAPQLASHLAVSTRCTSQES
jgi:hypothetical protein